ncbi:MAG: penicillin-binding protein 2 [Candidatus Eisenbacteria bacterium]
MRERTDPRRPLRTGVLGGIVLIAFLVLVGRLFQMQVLVSGKYRAHAEENQIHLERVKALRGRITGRDGAVYADSRPSFSVAVVPFEIRRNPAVLERLADLIGADLAALREQAAKGYSRPFDPRAVLPDADIAIVSIVEEHAFELSGVLILTEPVRVYPGKRVAAHVLGYVGEISEKEIAERKGGVSLPGARVGRGGLERWHDEVLRGHDGYRIVQEDAHGRRMGTLREKEPVSGEDLLVALDWGLQARAESLLAEHGSGTVVALDPENGEVLVLASHPSFDPNLFSVSVSAAVWDSLSGDSLHPLLDRAIQATFPPGSTYKPITAIEGLEQRVVGPETRLLPCFGSWQFGRRAFRCWRPEGHGSLALPGAIEQSCDVYFYQVGARLDLDRFAEAARALGLGERTGIELPGERSGLVPDTRYMNERYGKSGWGGGALLNHSIGQGEILVTPMQIARLYAALGSGRIVQPHLVLRTTGPDGRTTRRAIPSPRPVPLSEEVLRPVREGLVLAVEGDRATGRAARVPGVPVAGKTGTAQNPHGEDHAWFAAWAPASDPRIVVAVIIENAGHGGEVAAPLAGNLLRYFFGREKT